MNALWSNEKTMNSGMNVITDDFSKEPTNDHPKSTLKFELKISDLIVYK